MFSNIRISKLPGSCLYSLNSRYVFINVEKYSPSIFVSVFSNYAVAKYRKLAIRKTGVNLLSLSAKISGKYQIHSSAIETKTRPILYHMVVRT